jgi:putative ABC transport system permease protein
MINAIVLRPLPFRNADRLVYLNETAPRWDLTYTSINYPDFVQWRKAVRSFEGVALLQGASVNLADRTGSDRVFGAVMTYDYPKVMGLEPVLGRAFTPEEDRPNGPKVVLLGTGLWKSRFGGARDVVGQTIRINSEPYTIVGVLPREAELPGDYQLWLPLAGDASQPYQNYRYQGVGRLKPGVTLDAARADLLAAHAPIWAATDTSHTVRPVVESLRDHLSRDYQTMAAALALGVLLVLLSACTNVAGTMLARAIIRQREIALRAALGANPGRVGRQLMVESVVLAAVAGVLGSVAGYLGLTAFVANLPGDIPHWMKFEVDARTVIAAIAIVGATAVIFGLAPTLHARKQDAGAVLTAGGRSSLAAPQRRVLHGFVVAEVALATVLLVAGGLLFKAYRRVLDTDPGFRVDHILSFRVSLPAARYADSVALRAFFPRLMDRIGTLPEVVDASWITCPPLSCHEGNFFDVDGAPPRGANEANPVVLTLWASDRYLATLGIRLIRGRWFRPDEGSPGQPRPVVVSEEFLRAKLPAGGDPIGRTIHGPGDTTRFAIVGVVGDVRHYGLDLPARPTVYLPAAASVSQSSFAVLVRTRQAPLALTNRVRAAVRELDPELPLFDVGTMEDALARSLAIRRMLAAGLALFAMVALILAVGGIYAVLSYVVGRRSAELGIRLALGARRSQVVGLVLSQGMKLVLVGLGLGIPASLALGRLLSSQLVGTSSKDPLTIAAVVLILVATGLVAALVPAARASGVDPKAALAAE